MKNFIIISGSSGSGKTTLLELLSRDLNIEISVSYTTRNKRKYEIDGVHYNFINKNQKKVPAVGFEYNNHSEAIEKLCEELNE